MTRGRWSELITDEQYREKLKAKTTMNERGCWEWQGFRHKKGYGDMSYRCENWSTHRLSYHLFRGAIPEGWDVCHTCDNPPCVNPLHLFAAPRVANLIDMRNKGRNRQTQKTHCPKGHSYAEYGKPHYSKPTWRMCILCNREKSRENMRSGKHREWQRARRARKKAELTALGKTEKP